MKYAQTMQIIKYILYTYKNKIILISLEKIAKFIKKKSKLTLHFN